MAKIRPLMLLPPLLFGALAVTFFIGMQREDPDALPSALTGRPAPAADVTPMEGRESFSDADLRQGTVKLVNYWASWCAPCRVEHPQLLELAEEGVTLYGINYKDQPLKAEAFLRELGDPYAAVAADLSGRTALDWGLYGVPETFVLDAKGTVILRFAGPITQSVLENTIRPAIEAAAGGS